MLRAMTDNLSRQAVALNLLEELIEEEFSLLGKLNPKGVMALEFSIQELMRQIAQERIELRSMLSAISPGRKLIDALGEFPEPYASRMRSLMLSIDRSEGACAAKAKRNYSLALGLYDQSQGYVDFIQQKIVPKSEVYSSRGRYGKTSNMQGAIISGRL